MNQIVIKCIGTAQIQEVFPEFLSVRNIVEGVFTFQRSVVEIGFWFQTFFLKS